MAGNQHIGEGEHSSVDKSLCMDESAAARVDYDRIVFHQLQRFLVHHVLGFGGKRAVQRQHIAFAED